MLVLQAVYNQPAGAVQCSLPHTKVMYLRQASALAARRATAGSVRRLATGKDVKFGVEGRALMLQGVDKLADAVQVRECRELLDFLLVV